MTKNKSVIVATSVSDKLFTNKYIDSKIIQLIK